MIKLYKDPDGADVFAAHDKALEVQIQTTTLKGESSDVDVLKQRVKQLEDELTKYNVSHLSP